MGSRRPNPERFAFECVRSVARACGDGRRRSWVCMFVCICVCYTSARCTPLLQFTASERKRVADVVVESPSSRTVCCSRKIHGSAGARPRHGLIFTLTYRMFPITYCQIILSQSKWIWNDVLLLNLQFRAVQFLVAVLLIHIGRARRDY